EFWDDLRSQRTRVVLTGVGIACGTFIVVVLLALGEGIKRAVMSELLGSYDAAIIIYPGMTTRPYQGLPPQRRIRFDEQDVPALMREVPDIDIASPVYGRSSRLTIPGSRTEEDVQVQGVDAAY